MKTKKTYLLKTRKTLIYRFMQNLKKYEQETKKLTYIWKTDMKT